jgi:SAM-dependent methyltransferase
VALDTEALYDSNATAWTRRKPFSISDFTGRPPVFELCGAVEGQRVLDLGCGEGYCTREMAARGAAPVLGVDLSAKMIESARKQEAETPLGIEYRQGDVRDLDLPDASFDLVLAVFVFSYVNVEDMKRAFREVRRLLTPGGRFVFAVPHPGLPVMRPCEPPFYFDAAGVGYFSGTDTRCEGEIGCVDGSALPVQLVHRPLESYFEALGEAGFTTLPTLRELRVTEAHVERHPELFRPLVDVPLHLAFRLDVPA